MSGSWSLNEDLALVGYYQYEWEKTQLNPVGDYFGSDTFGPGAEFYRLGSGVVNSLPNGLAVGYAGEKDASDSGQWGLGVRYRITENTEVGAFHYRYNERIGSMFFDFTGTTQYSSLKGIGTTAPRRPTAWATSKTSS